jgi:hypothetical protein
MRFTMQPFTSPPIFAVPLGTTLILSRFAAQ